ncbi:citrate lyase acyl carrier protein [Clostridium sp.]|uniref:citrate lyase acyl carrier protein n=1 Tax=Clostridium sp. TaxID=1506 RepID=UPI003D6CF550
MIGQAGREKSDDVLVQVDIDTSEGIKIDIESKVKQLFGKQIEKSVKKVLCEMNVANAYVTLKDQGALDFVIRARVKTAIKRAIGGVK